jgi:paraquat-inducible protein B
VAREASRTLIGAFVLGAVGLAVAGITVLGSGKLLRKRPTAVMFFSGSITGLSVGSPVEFRGVRIGEVTRIAAVFDPADLSIAIPVYVEFEPRSLVLSKRGRDLLGEAADLFATNRFYQPLLDKGLKAQLEVQSIITGQLYISVDFHPEAPAHLVGLETAYPEIPTVPSLREQILETLRKLPDQITGALAAVQQLVESPAAQERLQELGALVRDVAALVREVRTEVKPLATSLRSSSEAAQRLITQAEQTLDQAGASLEQVRSTLGSYERVAAQGGNLGYDVTRTLGELEAAARALRSLADYLERHPESVLKGRR